LAKPGVPQKNPAKIPPGIIDTMWVELVCERNIVLFWVAQ
jgi:hypothetical protein